MAGLNEAERGLLIHDSQDEDLRFKALSSSVVFIRTFEEAEQYNVPVIHAWRNEEIRFILRKTNHPKSQLSNKAREQLFLDAVHLEKTWLRRKLDGFREEEFTCSQSNKTAKQYDGKLLADHYQVTTSTVSRIVARGRKASSAAAKPRSGRPSVLNRIQQQYVLKVNNKVGGCSIRTLKFLLEADPPGDYLTRYKGNERHSPGSNALWRLLQREEVTIQTVRFRPKLSEANQQERLAWCSENLLCPVSQLRIDDGDAREAFVRRLETLVDVDECYLVYSVGTGKLFFLPEDLDQADSPKNVVMDEWKKNPPKILVFGAITAPRLLNPRTSHIEGAKFDPVRRGIVQLRRVRAVSKYQRKTKHHQRHDLKFSDCSVNGSVYEYMMTGPKGLADFLDSYHSDGIKEDDARTTAWGIPLELTSDHQKKKGSTLVVAAVPASSVPSSPLAIRIQQDNAGGHGFNNLQGGKPTETQLRMVDGMQARGYGVCCQPRHSPEFNMLDLGFWNSIKTAIRQRCHEIQALPNPTHALIQQKMWEIVKEVVIEYHPAKLFSIAVQKQVLMEECIRLKGGSILKEPHIGIVQFWGL